MALTYTEAQIQAKLDSIPTLAETIEEVSGNVGEVESEVNSLSGTVTELDGTVSALSTKVEETFTSVSNGKSLVASAITDKGVATASDATFQQMATNIGNIKTGGYIVMDTVATSKSYQLDNNKTYYVATMMAYSTSQANWYIGTVTNGVWSAKANGYRNTSYNQYVLPNMSIGANYCILSINPMNSSYPTQILIAEVVS